jgi:hypothetical protein
MKKFVYALVCLAVATLFISAGTAKAQGVKVVQSWDFESTLSNWASGANNASIALSTDHAHGGTQSLKMVKPASGTEINLQNDVYKPQQGDSLSAWVWISTADLADLNGFQVFWQDGSGWTWHSKWINGTDLHGSAWNQVGVTFPAITSPMQRIGLQFTGQSTSAAHTPTMYVDDVTILRSADTTLVSQWGSTPRGANGWTILNTASTQDGSASMGGSTAPTGWMSIKGGFSTVTATTSQAFVISGTFEFVGGGGNNAYTWLRYALFNEDGTLSHKDSSNASWSETSNGYGYIFMPVSGVGTVSNTYNTWPQGNQGTEWPLINSKSWNSSNTNGGGPYSTVYQRPGRQVATAGVYDWAISVQPRSDGLNEVRWYFVQQHAAGSNNYYWWGGTFIDSAHVTTKFNSIGFACNNDVDATLHQVNLANVRATLGSPITIPTAPFQAFYVDAWGTTPRGSAWPILNDSTYLIGNAAMGSTAAPSGWASIKGGFRETVTATTSKALIISGTFEFVGGGGNNAYTWLRYALFNGAGALTGQNTPAAAWSETSNGYGYIFMPVSGVGTVSNTYNTWPQGNQGTEWPLINSKSWNSSNTNGGGPYSTIYQQPARQVAAAGVYDWAMSVQPLASGGNEVRWYFIQQHAAGSSNYYWWGGSFVDPTPVTTTFNSIGFAVNSDVDATCKQVNLANVKVDLGAPITVPKAPWAAYYLSNWGFYGGKTGGWTFTAGSLIGNATISGSQPNSDLSSVRAGFVSPVALDSGKALTVTGSVEFVGGGFEALGTLRCGMFYNSNPGTVGASGWSGTEGGSSGYLFLPPSGTNGPLDWAGKLGTWGGVVNGVWRNPGDPGAYVLGTNLQSPSNAVGSAGVYDFTISVAPLGAGQNQVSFSLVKEDKSYSFTVMKIDSHSPAFTQFNGVEFALNHGNSTTAVNFTNVKVDMVPVITSVQAPPVAGTIPTAYALNQNYPNPFNPSTTISYDLPKNSQVSVTIYDILGRAVATLVDGVQPASSYSVQWNPSGLSSGVYFYRIQAQSLDGSGNFVAVKKLVLMK